MRFKENKLFLLLATVAIFIGFNTVLAKKSKYRFRLQKFEQKKDNVAKARGNFESKYGNIANLERRFETIRDLGSIVRCRLRSDETTVVTGNSLICGGKRYDITPEAAKDIEETATTKQTISFSPDGSPRDLPSTLKLGLYGKPIMSLLDESQTFQDRSNLLQPHEKYPSFGIYDKGMRTTDPALFTSSKPASVSFERGDNSMYDINDNPINNFGGMELGDISHALNNDDIKTENQDSFYRNEQLQNDAFEMSGKKSATNNPFAQYWKSLKASFYETTRSQLGDSGPVANRRQVIPAIGRVRAILTRREPSTKKSKIQQEQNVSARKTIPKPTNGASSPGGNLKKLPDLGHKRYFISGLQQQQYPISMFAGVPIGPWQLNSRGQMPVMRPFSGFPMMAQGLPSAVNQEVPQQGFVRSINRADEWGVRAAPRYFDPRATGSPIGAPINPIYAQMRANEYTEEPGLPTRGKFQYGIQPGNGPPFMGFASVPIMQPVPMGDDIGNGRPGFPGYGGMGGDFEAGEETGGYSRGMVPMNYGPNGESAPGRSNMVPGLVQGTAQQIPGSRKPVGLPMEGGMANSGQLYGLYQEEGFGREMVDESGSNPARSNGPQEDASEDFEKITGPENYVPAPFYRPPSYNPHESEDFFPDGTNERYKQDENAYFQKNRFPYSQGPYKEEVRGSEGNAAEFYEDEKRQEEEKEVQEEEKKRGTLRSTTTRIDVNGNKIEEDPDGKFILTKEHVGFGPITVEAKTAKSAMKDPSEDDE